ncbi:MAG: aminopeptidase [Verrucomicrobiota bacterium JB023]|nr:aminopeptidase [Verrucomicrobiota bacterium JB023]
MPESSVAMMARLSLPLFLAPFCLLSSCQTLAFYQQAIAGQWDILQRRQPIEALEKSPSTPPALRERFALTRELLAFAHDELHVPVEHHYTTYADLERPYVSYIITAAPEFSLEPKEWFYPVIGHQDYRGYFSKEDAIAYAQLLQNDGYEVDLGGTVAYSTLGFFQDPLLNTFIADDELDFADLLFHELSHHLHYRAQDTDYNEAFATFNARLGVERWLKKTRRHDLLEAYENRLSRRQKAEEKFESAREKLELLFASQLPVEEMRRRKSEILASLQSDIDTLRLTSKKPKPAREDLPYNNATVAARSTYYRLVPFFAALYEKAGRDLPTFYQLVKDSPTPEAPVNSSP